MSEVHSAYNNVVLTQTLSVGVSVNTRDEMDKHKSILLMEEDQEWQQQQQEEQEEEEEMTLINEYNNVSTDYQTKVQERATQPHSSFHFAGTAQFHNQLRRTVMMMVIGNDYEQNNHATLYSTHLTAVDGMCHEWPELKKIKSCKNANRLQESKGNEAVNESKTNKKNKKKSRVPGTSEEQSTKELVTKKSNQIKHNNSNITMASLPSQELSLLHRVAINESVLSELIDTDSEVTTLIVPEIHDTSKLIQEHNTEYSSPNEINSYRTFVNTKDWKITSARKVPSIREYVDNLRSSLNSVNVNINTNCTLLKRKRFTSARTSSNNEVNSISNLQKNEMQPQWQLLVDFREKFNGSHEQMIKLLERQCKCKVVSASLPIGDFVINVDMASNKNLEKFTNEEIQRVNKDAQESTSIPESLSPLFFSHLFPVVIERKTIEDVAASIKDGRYYEQRHLLQHSPFALVIWLIEGEVSNRKSNNNYYYRHHHQLYTNARTKCKHLHAKETNAFTQTQTKTNTNKCKEETSTISQIDEVWEVLSDTPDTVVNESKNKNKSNSDNVKGKDEEDDMYFRRLRSVIASLSSFTNMIKLDATSTTNTMVVRTKHIQESANFLSELAHHLMCSIHSTNNNNGNHELIYQFTESGATAKSNEQWETSHIESVHLSFTKLLNTSETFRIINEEQRVLNARTAPVRMLMCIRGCSSTLACLLLAHYGTILNLWRRLAQCTNVNNNNNNSHYMIATSTAANSATCHVDHDEIIQNLPISQKKIFVLLTEFLLAKEYL